MSKHITHHCKDITRAVLSKLQHISKNIISMKICDAYLFFQRLLAGKANEENRLHRGSKKQFVLKEDQKDERKKVLTKYILFLLMFLSVPILPQTTQSRTTQCSCSAADAGTRGRRTHSCLPTLLRWSPSNCCQMIWSQINIHKSVLHYVKFLSCTANSEYRLLGFCVWLLLICTNSLEEYF